jgi:hypothetical protein
VRYDSANDSEANAEVKPRGMEKESHEKGDQGARETYGNCQRKGAEKESAAKFSARRTFNDLRTDTKIVLVTNRTVRYVLIMQTKTTSIEKEIIARAKAFTGFGIQTLKFLVTADDVKPYDSIAGHYTGCNSLSVSAKKRIRKLAGI